MAQDLQLELRDGTNTYSFDVGPDWQPEFRPEHKRSADPPELTRVTETWEFRAARITGNTVEACWDNLQTFLGHVLDRTADPLNAARIVRDPSGVAVVERTLGSPTHQEFTFELVALNREPEAELRAAQYRSIVTVDLRLVAVQVFADGNGIVDWDQRFSIKAGPDGNATVEQTTTITTAEGVSAVTAALLYAPLPIASYPRATWDTNNVDGSGIDYEVVDADSANSRTPTRVVAVSRIKQWGISFGTPAAGQTVGTILAETETITEEGRIETITRARAGGPGALNWVTGRAPPGPHQRIRILDRPSARYAEAEWRKVVQKDKSDTGGGTLRVVWEVQVKLSGGGQQVGFAPVTGNKLPQKVLGTFQPWRLEIAVGINFVGIVPTKEDVKFPTLDKLEDWTLIPAESTEDPIPALKTPGSSAEFNEWRREATLVYQRADEPDLDELRNLQENILGGGEDVDSYRLPA